MKYLKSFENNNIYHKYKRYVNKYVIWEHEPNEYSPEYCSLVKIYNIEKLMNYNNEEACFFYYNYIHFIHNGEKIQKNQGRWGSKNVLDTKIIKSFNSLKEAKKQWKKLNDYYKNINKYNL